jgi:hypothetical protein
MAKWPEKIEHYDGHRMQFDFDNYIVSVVKFTGSYGYKDGLWEVAFMDRETANFVEPPLDFMNEYSFSGDVGIYGHLNDPEVDRIVQAMEKLDNAN